MVVKVSHTCLNECFSYVFFCLFNYNNSNQTNWLIHALIQFWFDFFYVARIVIRLLIANFLFFFLLWNIFLFFAMIIIWKTIKMIYDDDDDDYNKFLIIGFYNNNNKWSSVKIKEKLETHTHGARERNEIKLTCSERARPKFTFFLFFLFFANDSKQSNLLLSSIHPSTIFIFRFGLNFFFLVRLCFFSFHFVVVHTVHLIIITIFFLIASWQFYSILHNFFPSFLGGMMMNTPLPSSSSL